jgi:hypothetical protein
MKQPEVISHKRDNICYCCENLVLEISSLRAEIVEIRHMLKVAVNPGPVKMPVTLDYNHRSEKIHENSKRKENKMDLSYKVLENSEKSEFKADHTTSKELNVVRQSKVREETIHTETISQNVKNQYASQSTASTMIMDHANKTTSRKYQIIPDDNSINIPTPLAASTSHESKHPNRILPEQNSSYYGNTERNRQNNLDISYKTPFNLSQLRSISNEQIPQPSSNSNHQEPYFTVYSPPNPNQECDLNSTTSTLVMETCNNQCSERDKGTTYNGLLSIPVEEVNTTSLVTSNSVNLLNETTPNHPSMSNINFQRTISDGQKLETLQNSNVIDEANLRLPAYTTGQCLVVKGLPESNSDIPKTRLKDDLLLIQSCFSFLLRGDESLEICKAFRLGKYDPSSSPRPIKIILKEEVQRNVLLQRKFLLRSYTPCVFFQKEYTPKERHKYRELYSAMKLRMELGETSLMIRNGEIIKRKSSFLWNTPVTISHRSSNVLNL